MRRILIATLAFVAVIVPGLAYGIWSGRWTWSDEPQASARKLADVPAHFGDWDGVDVEMEARVIEIADLEGFVSRNYTYRFGAGSNAEKQVQVFLACGRAGPVCVHTPDVCYRGAGFQMVGSEQKKTVTIPGGGKAEFYTATFRKPGPLQSNGVQIFWAWGSDGKWQAPDSPRLEYAGRLALFKMYVVCPLLPKKDSVQESTQTCEQFLAEFLPQLDRTLFAQ